MPSWSVDWFILSELFHYSGPQGSAAHQQKADSDTNTSLPGFAGPEKKLLAGDVVPHRSWAQEQDICESCRPGLLRN